VYDDLPLSGLARYVFLTAGAAGGEPLTAPLNVAELMVIDEHGVNVALGKPCYTNGAYEHFWLNVDGGYKLTDGNTAGGQPEIVHSSSAESAYRDAGFAADPGFIWFMVDLGDVVNVSRVGLWNRVDCCDERLSKIDARIVLVEDTSPEFFDASDNTCVPAPEPFGVDVYALPCDASARPLHGDVGNCTNALPIGASCRIECDANFTATRDGRTTCAANGADELLGQRNPRGADRCASKV
jgi:hypothetical protein